MSYGALAGLVVTLHLAFVLFVLFGGLLLLRWPWIRWVHLPAAAWGAQAFLADPGVAGIQARQHSGNGNRDIRARRSRIRVSRRGRRKRARTGHKWSAGRPWGHA